MCKGRAVAWLLLLSFLIPLPALSANEDRTSKREVCRVEARERIKLRQTRSLETFQRRIERRVAYVQNCMERPLDEWATGSVVGKPVPPLPPPRPKDAVGQGYHRAPEAGVSTKWEETYLRTEITTSKLSAGENNHSTRVSSRFAREGSSG
jgi:hypothetical protein